MNCICRARTNDPQYIAWVNKSLMEKRRLFALEPYIPRVYGKKSDLINGSLLRSLLRGFDRSIERYQLWRHPDQSETRDVLLMAWDSSAVPHCVVVRLT